MAGPLTQNPIDVEVGLSHPQDFKPSYNSLQIKADRLAKNGFLDLSINLNQEIIPLNYKFKLQKSSSKFEESSLKEFEKALQTKWKGASVRKRNQSGTDHLYVEIPSLSNGKNTGDAFSFRLDGSSSIHFLKSKSRIDLECTSSRSVCVGDQVSLANFRVTAGKTFQVFEKGVLDLSGELRVSAGNFDHSGTVNASELKFTQNSLANSGDTAVLNTGLINIRKALVMRCSRQAQNKQIHNKAIGTISCGGSVTMYSPDILIEGKLHGSSINLDMLENELKNSNETLTIKGEILATDRLNISHVFNVDNQGLLYGNKAVTIDTNNNLSQNKNGTILCQGKLEILTKEKVDLNGKVQSLQTEIKSGSINLEKGSDIISTYRTTLDAKHAVKTAGSVYSVGECVIDGKTWEHTGEISSQNTLACNVIQKAKISGKLHSYHDLVLSGENASFHIQEIGEIIAEANFYTRSNSFHAEGTITAQKATIHTSKDIDLQKTAQLVVATTLKFFTDDGVCTNRCQIVAKTVQAFIKMHTFHNTDSGKIAAEEDVIIDAAAFDQEGQIETESLAVSAKQTIRTGTQSYMNAPIIVLEAENTTIGGKIHTTLFKIDTKENLETLTQSRIHTHQEFNMRSNHFNHHGHLYSKNGTIDADTFDNKSEVIVEHGLKLTGLRHLANTGCLDGSVIEILGNKTKSNVRAYNYGILRGTELIKVEDIVDFVNEEDAFLYTNFLLDFVTEKMTNRGKISGKGVHFYSKHLVNLGDLQATQQFLIDALKYHENDPKLTSYFENHGNLQTQTAVLNISRFMNMCKGNVDVTKDFYLTPSEAISNQTTWLINDGKIHIHDLASIMVDFLVTDGTFISKNLVLSLKEFFRNDQKGNLNISESLEMLKRAESVFNSGNLSVKNSCRIIAEMIANKKDITTGEELLLDAKGLLALSQESKIKAENAHVYLKGETAHFKAPIINAKNLTTEAKIFYDEENYISGTGQFQNVKASENFTYITDHNLTINRQIERTSNVALKGTQIGINIPLASAHDLSFESTKSDIQLRESLTARNLSLISAAKIDIHGLATTAEEDIHMKAKHTISNHHGIIYAGERAYFESTEGEIHNYSGTMQGEIYLQLNAEGSIYNHVLAIPYQGPHDTMYNWIPAQLIGGEEGIAIKTNNKVMNDASDIIGEGTVSMEAKHGVESTPRTHYYKAHESSKRKFLGKDKTVVYQTQIHKANIHSKNGGINVFIKEGKAYLFGTDITAKDKISFHAEEGFEMFDVKGVTHVYQSKSRFMGLARSSYSEKHEFAVPVDLATREDIEINARKIETEGVNIQTPKKLSATGDDIEFGQRKLQHEIEKKSRGFGISLCGIPVFSVGCELPKFDPSSLAQDPTVTRAKRLFQSNGAVETLFNGINLAQSVINTTNVLTQAYRSQQLGNALLNRYGLGSFSPSVGISFVQQKERSTWETVGEGSISVGEMDIHARNKLTFKYVPVHVENNAKIVAPTFTQQGADLQSTHVSSTSKVGVTLSNQGYGADVSHSEMKSNKTQWINQSFTVGNTLEVDVTDWNLNAANTEAKILKGNVSGELNIQDKLDTFKTRSSSSSASTSGAFSHSQSKMEGAEVNTSSGIHVKESLNTQTDPFQIHEIRMKGGHIISDKKINIDPTKITTEEVNEYTKGRSMGVSGNIKDFKPEKKDAKKIDTKEQEGNEIKTLPVNFGTRDKKGTKTSLIHGKEGTNLGQAEVKGPLVTDPSQMRTTHKDSTHQYTLEIPILDSGTMKQMKDNFNWLGSRLGGDPYVQKPLSERVQTHENLKSPKDIENHAKAVRNYASLSDASYQTDDKNLPEGFKKAGEYYDKENDIRVVFYRNPQTKELCISSRGTDSMKNVTKDDMDLYRARLPQSFNESMKQAVEKTIKENPEYQVTFTGHSLGAALSSMLSSHFKKPAYVFDNPGVDNKNQNLNFSQVTSFQASEHIVNQAGPLGGHKFDQGKVVQLCATPSQRIFMQATSKLGGFGILGGTTYMHKLSEISKQLEHSYLKPLEREALK